MLIPAEICGPKPNNVSVCYLTPADRAKIAETVASIRQHLPEATVTCEYFGIPGDQTRADIIMVRHGAEVCGVDIGLCELAEPDPDDKESTDEDDDDIEDAVTFGPNEE